MKPNRRSQIGKRKHEVGNHGTLYLLFQSSPSHRKNGTKTPGCAFDETNARADASDLNQTASNWHDKREMKMMPKSMHPPR